MYEEKTTKTITIIGSSQYYEKMLRHKEQLEHENKFVRVFMPAFDSSSFDELQICLYNNARIKEADEIHVFWDQRSMGTLFDLGICFALSKPIKIIYLEKKTFANVMKMYEEKSKKYMEE